MPDDDESQEQQDWATFLWNEFIWLMGTAATIILTVAVARLLTHVTRAGGIDLNLMGNPDIGRAVEDAVRRRQGEDDEDLT